MLVDLTLPQNEDTLMVPKPGTDEDDYPGGGFEAEQLESIEEDGAVVYRFSQNTHTGTHIDSPAHYTPDGRTVDQLKLEHINGEAQVVDLRSHAGELITADILEAEAPDLGYGERVLFLTGDVDEYYHNAAKPNRREFFEEAAAFSIDGAEWIADREPAVIGNDFVTESLDISRGKSFNPERPVHGVLCGAGIPIMEYLCNVDPIIDMDSVDLSCLPVKLTGLEASPARTIAKI